MLCKLPSEDVLTSAMFVSVLVLMILHGWNRCWEEYSLASVLLLLLILLLFALDGVCELLLLLLLFLDGTMSVGSRKYSTLAFPVI